MFLLIDKPKGITSHDVIDRVRRIIQKESPSPRLRRIKVGHAGTLDPNATGLLIVGVGRESTKKLGTLTKDTKKGYEAEIFLGEERDTDDVEGVTIAKAKGFLPPSENEVEKALKTFVGKQKQLPPSFSAIKIKGKKAYQLARKGKEVKMPIREVEVYSMKLIEYRFPILKISTEVSAGTYVRALARDIGKKLGCGAYLNNLKRTKIGKHNSDKATRLQYISASNWKKLLVSI